MIRISSMEIGGTVKKPDIVIGKHVESDQDIQWKLYVTPPAPAVSERLAFISVDEETTLDGKVIEQGGLFMDIRAAEWLLENLPRAIMVAKEAETAAAQPRCKRKGCNDLAAPSFKYCRPHAFMEGAP